MNFRKRRFLRKEYVLWGIAACLFLPALLVNLDLIAFYNDEGIRALVALEMDISGNYITPTLFGEFYYNKPPLYNWILLAAFKLAGRYDEMVARLVTVFFLLLFAGTVWYFNRPVFTAEGGRPGLARQFPVLVALALVTCGRVLFWDSLLALIDVCFSWVIYLLMLLVFREGERQRYGRLFAWAYLLAAIGFLLKGLPALVCLFISLTAYFFWVKKWRPLLSWQHLAGIGIFMALAGGYLALYAQQNSVTQMLKTLFEESAKRTLVEHGWLATVRHLFTFPFEMWYHFLPWTLPVVYFFKKSSRRLILENRLMTWQLLIFCAGILPYWWSVEVYPRYLLMQVPLIFSVFFYMHFKNTGTRIYTTLERIFYGCCLLAIVACLFFPLCPALAGAPLPFIPGFISAIAEVPYLYLKSGVLLAMSIAFAWGYESWAAHRTMVFILVLMLARLGFGWFVLPARLQAECSTKVRKTTLAAAKLIQERPFFIYKGSLGFQPVTSWYFTRETRRILKAKYKDFDKNDLYLVSKEYEKRKFRDVATITTLWECGEMRVAELNQ